MASISQRVCERQPSKGSVLVVDDSRLVRAMVGGYLTQAGFDGDEAADGAEALGKLTHGAFDVLVTDLRMPVMGGFALMEAARGLGTGPEVIVLTGTHAGDVDSAVQALRLGAHDYLPKPPPSPDKVVLTVQRAVEKKRLRDENARLLRELAALSRTDPLTGAGNRRAFEEALATERARAGRHGLPLSLIMLDLDHFKKVNDTCGHRTGDAVLQRFVGLATGALRAGDGLYRYGGEEFAALLAHTPLAGALETADRLVATVAATPFRVGAQRLEVTCSAGVACWDGDEAASDDIVARADAALYRAKQTGRNRACTDANLAVIANRVVRFRSARRAS